MEKQRAKSGSVICDAGESESGISEGVMLVGGKLQERELLCYNIFDGTQRGQLYEKIL